MQTAFTFERQLPANTTLAFTYTNSHGLHQFRSEDVPGAKGPLFLMTSAGLYNQNQLMFNVTSRVSSNASLFGFYILNRARSNTDGIGTFPANPYNFQGEYGPASTDIQHRVNFGGSINMKWHVKVSPYA